MEESRIDFDYIQISGSKYKGYTVLYTNGGYPLDIYPEFIPPLTTKKNKKLRNLANLEPYNPKEIVINISLESDEWGTAYYKAQIPNPGLLVKEQVEQWERVKIVCNLLISGFLRVKQS